MLRSCLPVRWGVLGAASIAVQRVIPAINEAPSASILALASRDGEKARHFAQMLGVPRAYASYEALLTDPDIDAVYVPLPNHLHFEWAVRALEAGKHVLCEKPLCVSSKQVAQLCVVRNRTGKHIEEAFGYRSHPQWTKLGELLRANEIGTVRALYAVLAKQFMDPADVRNNLAAGGGAIYDLGSYAISACNIVFARSPQRVIAAIERDPQYRIDRLSSALLDYGDSHATLTVASQSGPSAWATHQQLCVLGSTGWIRLNFPFAQARPVGCRLELGNDASVGAIPSTAFDFEPVNQYMLQMERYSRLLRRELVPSWPIEDALISSRIMESLFESTQHGGWHPVEVDAWHHEQEPT